MAELETTVPQLPIDHPDRVEVDQALRYFTNMDLSRSYVFNRGAHHYVAILHGLSYLFDYLRQVGTSNRIVDIGGGITRAAYQLSLDPMTQGLEVWATVLRKEPAMLRFLHPLRVIETSVEYLDGIDKESVVGVLSTVSIGYSVAPEYAIRRIDEILVPGGVIKATFNNGDFSMAEFKKHNRFTTELARLGYDVETHPHKVVSMEPPWSVVLAVKPGQNSGISAKELFQRDLNDEDNQRRSSRHYMYENLEEATEDWRLYPQQNSEAQT